MLSRMLALRSGHLTSLILIALTTGVLVAGGQITELLVLNKTVELELFLTILVLMGVTAGLILARFKAADPGQVAAANISALTAREMDIFQMLFEGKTNKEIASVYSIELSTVKTHVNNLYTKLRVSNRKEARELYRREIFSRTPSFVHPR